MEKSDISIYAKSDQHYLVLIGEFIRSNRIQQGKTQEELSVAAGVNRSTLIQIEKGNPVNLLSLIQILRALKKLDVLNQMELRPQISPLKLAALEEKQTLRVRRKNNKKSTDLPKSDW